MRMYTNVFQENSSEYINCQFKVELINTGIWDWGDEFTAKYNSDTYHMRKENGSYYIISNTDHRNRVFVPSRDSKSVIESSVKVYAVIEIDDGNMQLDEFKCEKESEK